MIIEFLRLLWIGGRKVEFWGETGGNIVDVWEGVTAPKDYLEVMS